MMNKCKFSEAWRGACGKETEEGKEYCKEHYLDPLNPETDSLFSKNQCRVCKEQATHECAETFQFVCGVPLCDKFECKDKHHPGFYKERT